MTIITHILMFVSKSFCPYNSGFTDCAHVDFFVCWASAEFVKQKMVTRTLPKISRKANKVKSTDVLLEYVRTNGAGKLLLPVADSEPPAPAMARCTILLTDSEKKKKTLQTATP